MIEAIFSNTWIVLIIVLVLAFGVSFGHALFFPRVEDDECDCECKNKDVCIL